MCSQRINSLCWYRNKIQEKQYLQKKYIEQRAGRRARDYHVNDYVKTVFYYFQKIIVIGQYPSNQNII